MELAMERRFLALSILFVLISRSDCSGRVKRIVGGIYAAKPPEDDPVVFVNRDDRNARVYGSRDPGAGFYVFRGIRFGEPPVGRSRFQRARAVHLDGEYNATIWGPPCPQLHKGNVIGSEDCLFLNVFTPALPDSGDGYPVLIWIHGGGFRIGAACQYEMRNLIKKHMVVISIQYRLGSLGFLSTGTRDLPGNNGMFDMTLAVNWVKKYIGYFGGNPDRIVAFGQGTGASSALMLSLSTLTKNHFSGLIAMSGTILSNFVFDRDPMQTTKFIAFSHGCPTDDVTAMVRCLQELPVEKLISVDSKLSHIRMVADGFISEISALLGAGPVVEGRDDERGLPNFMTDKPENILNLGNFPKIPLLTGVVKDETGDSISGGYSNEIQNKLKTIPDFLNKELLPSLQNTIPFFGNSSRQFIPSAFSEYLKIPAGGKLKKSLKKVAEAVTDAIFNAPALMTLNYWSKKANAYFYSFDYSTKHSHGKNFLAGLPLVDAKDPSLGSTGHGDDLGFIFGHNDIFGDQLPPVPFSKEDEGVTDIFTDLISQFARTGKPGGDEASGGIPSFSSEDNSYISITDKIKPMKNFRFCEMSLWTGAVEKLVSPSCDVLRVTSETVERLGKETKKIVDLVPPIDTIKKPIDGLGNVGGKVIPGGIPTVSLPKIPTFGLF
ncbi:pyrethroid hydrolase Ces2a [Diachasma alloeum]|uniref:pyrethroid hydrolase Ces2a n=1 Tax=Diachasma alloeum TaxID=454923 RepID=UPI0007381AA6|nr:pyrethroid hydrolase Ces2a [Diachasma alloeum]